MDDIRNVPKLVECLPGYKIDNKTTKLRGTKPNEWRLHDDPSRECNFNGEGPKKT